MSKTIHLAQIKKKIVEFCRYFFLEYKFVRGIKIFSVSFKRVISYLLEVEEDGTLFPRRWAKASYFHELCDLLQPNSYVCFSLTEWQNSILGCRTRPPAADCCPPWNVCSSAILSD